MISTGKHGNKGHSLQQSIFWAPTRRVDMEWDQKWRPNGAGQCGERKQEHDNRRLLKHSRSRVENGAGPNDAHVGHVEYLQKIFQRHQTCAFQHSNETKTNRTECGSTASAKREIRCRTKMDELALDCAVLPPLGAVCDSATKLYATHVPQPRTGRTRAGQSAAQAHRADRCGYAALDPVAVHKQHRIRKAHGKDRAVLSIPPRGSTARPPATWSTGGVAFFSVFAIAKKSR